MFMNSSKLIFIFLIFFSPLISLSSSEWILSWVGMEIGMVGLLPMMILDFTSSSKEAAMKYFLIQALSSVLMLISGLMFFNYMIQSSLYIYLFLLGLSLKLGFFPGHFWVPSLVAKLGWFSNVMILGPLKIAPLGFLSLLINNFENITNLVLLLGGITTITGAILGNNQSTVRGMLGSSSISHSGWMLVSMKFGFLWMYLFSYLIILSFIFMGLYYMDMMGVGVMIFSLSGLPPYFMFLMKMKVLWFITVSLEYMILFLMILSSVISLNFYLKFI
uniref:NADH-ubiquinone oxidoreductase chain 2 n=1 Tax=Planorbarius corneus TaxID=240818 RepID=A0A7L7S125_9GAST|nr:NADH dehydrogenase subunit 2 [Planorbarius corneus]